MINLVREKNGLELHDIVFTVIAFCASLVQHLMDTWMNMCPTYGKIEVGWFYNWEFFANHIVEEIICLTWLVKKNRIFELN